MTAENDYRQLVEALAASEARERTLLSRCGDARGLLKEARFWIDRTRGAHHVAGRIDAFLAGDLPDAPAPETGDGR